MSDTRFGSGGGVARGPRGERGKTGPAGAAGMIGPTGAAGIATGAVMAVPARTLFVAQSWPTGVDPLVFFTTIAGALAQAATMNPSAFNPISIVIYPGTYSDPLTLVSNVSLFSTARRSTNITGPVTWTPGAGVNAAQAGQREEVGIVLSNILSTISIDASAKTGDVSAFDCRDAGIRGGLMHIARPGQSDFFQAWNLVALGTPMTFDNSNVNIFSSSTDSITCTGNCAIDVRACETFNPISISGTTVGSIEATQINGIVAIGSGCSVSFTGSQFQPGSIITVAAGGHADLVGAQWNSNANLAGAGTIDRSIWRTSVGPTVLGANVVPIAPPLKDNVYNISIAQTAGSPQDPPIVTAKTASSVTIDDSVGGGTFDVTILKE